MADTVRITIPSTHVSRGAFRGLAIAVAKARVTSNSSSNSVSNNAAAARDPRPASSNSSITCSGVSTATCWVKSDPDPTGASIMQVPSYPPGGAMTTYQLRPLTLGEILDGAFSVYRRHFPTFLSVAAVCITPGAALRVYATLGGGPLLHPWATLLAAIVQGVG